jgi:single-strand DNA-binding protein
VVTGRLKQRSYETKEGEKRIVLEVEADDVSVSPQVRHSQGG